MNFNLKILKSVKLYTHSCRSFSGFPRLSPSSGKSIEVIRKRWNHANAKSQNQTTLNSEEVRKFENLASSWWHPNGPMKELHSMNKLRVPLIRDGLLLQNEDKLELPEPLTGFSLLDVGCGGGILTEPLGRLGANILGIDPGKDNINAALTHLPVELSNKVSYECCTIEEFVGNNPDKLFDAVVSSETIEHVENPETFLQTAVLCLKPGGSLFLTTLNRTFESWAGAIIAWEYVLRKLPVGTHNWDKFMTPEELQKLLHFAGCRVKLSHGMFYNPFSNTWSWTRSTAINYCIHATKD